MSIVQMSKLAVCAMKDRRKEVLETLQSMGVMEIITLDDAEGTMKMDTTQSQMAFDRNAQIAANAVEILDRYAPEKKGLLASFAGKEIKKISDEKRIASEQSRIMDTAAQILACEKKIADDKANIVKCRSKIEVLTPWKTMDVPLNDMHTKATSVITGTLPGTYDEAAVLTMIAEKEPEIDAAYIQIIANEHETTYLAAVCLTEEADRLEGALREYGFARPSFGGVDAPTVRIARNEKRIENFERDIKETEAQIAGMADAREDLKMCADYYSIRSEKYHVLSKLPQTENAFFIEGYVPAKQVGNVAEKLEKDFGAFTEIEEIGENEDVPVALHNNGFASSVEGVLESFGLPKKGEFDPTMLTSVFFVVLFGLMLSDAAYGAIVSVATAVIILKCPNMEKGMKRLIQLFFWCGLSTIFWGVLFGGYFGDLVTVVAKTFFNKEVTIPALWFVPLENPMKLLIWSMIFGLVHLFTGLGIKGYMAIKDKDIVAFIFDVLCWFLLLIGLLLMLIPTSIFAGIAQRQITFPEPVNILAKVMAIVGALGILIMSARNRKNFGLRLAMGAYELYGISGWLSDVLSYSRLLALGLATGVIASVINKMGTMLGGGVVGAIVFIIVFFIGHLFNLGINLLGAYVHTCRLQYVEFFGKFYDGGGKPFEPFTNKTKFVDFKEEENHG